MGGKVRRHANDVWTRITYRQMPAGALVAGELHLNWLLKVVSLQHPVIFLSDARIGGLTPQLQNQSSLQLW